MNTYSKTRGFSLIEFLVLIAFSTLIASIILATVNIHNAHTHEMYINDNLTQVQIAFNLYKKENGGYPSESGPCCIAASNCFFAGERFSKCSAFTSNLNFDTISQVTIQGLSYDDVPIWTCAHSSNKEVCDIGAESISYQLPSGVFYSTVDNLPINP